MSGLCVAGSDDPNFSPTGTTYNVVPLRAVMNDDVRVVWFGDSFTVGASWRVSGASLQTWPITSDVTAATTGDTRGTVMQFSTVLNEDVGSIGESNLYRLYQSGPDSSLDIRFALPIWSIREYYETGSSSSPRELVRYQGRNLLDHTAVGRFSEPGESLRVRPLFLQSRDGVPVGKRVYSSSIDSITIDPSATSTTAGQLGVWHEDLEVVADANGIYEFELIAPPSTDPGYIQAPGFTIYEIDESGSRQPGLSWAYLADNSWSYADFGRDVAAQAGVYSKTFSEQQLSNWFAATTLDPEQPVFVFYYFAIEPSGGEIIRDEILGFVEQTEAAAAAAGTGPLHHCFVVPHMHFVTGGLGFNQEQFRVVRDAAVQAARQRDDMSVLSIFDATDGVLFDGSSEAQQWIADAGHTPFVYGDQTFDYLDPAVAGDLLDSGRLHPEFARRGAQFFSWYAGRSIVEACPADFSAPYGVLDLADINVFVNLFVDDAYAADLSRPWGLLDLHDLQKFVGSFTAGCD